MKNSKRISSIIAGSVLVASAIATPAWINMPAVFAEEIDNPTNDTPHVYVEGSTEDLYVTTGCQSNKASTVEYCATGNTMTFNGYNGDSINVQGIDSINITFSGVNTFSPQSTESGAKKYSGSLFLFDRAMTNINIKGTDGSLVKVGQTTTKPATSSALVVLFSGAIGTHPTLTIEGGKYELNTTSTGITSNLGGMVFADMGQTKINNSDFQLTAWSNFDFDTTSVELHNTVINSTDRSTIAASGNEGDFIVDQNSNLMLSKFFALKGNLIINSGNVEFASGINAQNVTMNSGQLNVTGDVISIAVDGTIKFLGGTTTINNTDNNYFISAGNILSPESEHGIVIGENMCLMGGVISTGHDGLVSMHGVTKDTRAVTITEGACPVNPDDPGTNPGVVPNTGFETSKAIVATIIALPTLIAAAILGRFFYRRYSQRVSFKK